MHCCWECKGILFQPIHDSSGFWLNRSRIFYESVREVSIQVLTIYVVPEKSGYVESMPNANQCGSVCDQMVSIDTTVSQQRLMLTYTNQYRSIWLNSFEPYWSALINKVLYWEACWIIVKILSHIDPHWLALGIDPLCPEKMFTVFMY